MKVAVTGHRPQSLGKGWNDHKLHREVKKELQDYLSLLKPDLLLSGMALGVDQWAVEWAIESGTPFVAALPFKNQFEKWTKPIQDHYHKLLKQATQVVLVDRQPGYIDPVVAPDLYRNNKMQTRNQWLVDQLDPLNHDKLVAVIDENKSHSGTHNCLQYAEDHNKGRIIVRIPVDKMPAYSNKYGSLKDDDLPF